MIFKELFKILRMYEKELESGYLEDEELKHWINDNVKFYKNES